MFHGRYGYDDLNRTLVYATLGLFVLNLVLSIFVPFGVLRQVVSILSLLCIVFSVLRMFSRNFTARQKENAAFLRFKERIKGTFRRGPKAKVVQKNPTFAERRKYKYFICTQCAQRLRVPRGKGKLRVTCNRCGNKFEIKS